MMVHTGRASGVVALDLTSVPMLVSDTVTNGFEFSVTRERFRPAGTSADRDCSRSSPPSRCRTSHGPAGSISEAHGLLDVHFYELHAPDPSWGSITQAVTTSKDNTI